MAELAVAGALASVELVFIKVERRSSSSPRNEKDDDIAGMKRWLDSMKAFIQDNDGCEEAGGSNSRLEVHMKKVRDIVYDIEDVLDQDRLHSPPYQFHTHQWIRNLHDAAHQTKHGLPRHKISHRIAGIKSSIEEIQKQHQYFSGSSSATRPSTSNFSRVSPLLRDHEMVGFDTAKRDLISVLEGGGNGLVRLAVVGPCGSGKTTLVKNVFWTMKFRVPFECHAWVHVGRNSDAGDLLINLLKQLGFKTNSCDDIMDHNSYPNILEKLRNYLARIRYVIVLDNVSEDIQWSSIKDAFPDESLGSRIIVTTTSSKVASSIASMPQYVFNLKGLEWLHAWNLFCRVAFPGSKGECPSELKDCSVKIAKRCEGLPLAIVAVGGALTHKNQPHELERFHDNLGSTWQDSELKVIGDALLPDYKSLSSNLKSCFLYFSIFPEDYSVQRGRLIRLWVAEGFAMGTDNETAEEVAEDYLNELIRKNLVHVSESDVDGRPRSCRVLNLVLAFIVQKCNYENFASIYNGERASCSSKNSERIRRLSVHHDCTNLPPNSDFGGNRSMFQFRFVSTSLASQKTSRFSKYLQFGRRRPSEFDDKRIGSMELLKVLDFQTAPLTQFPSTITDLTLLKYLNFRGTQITTIPSSIKKLYYLETLDLQQTDVTELPEEISHLQNLSHLFAYKSSVNNYEVFDSVRGVRMHNSIGKLTGLQDLSCVKVGERGTILKELKNLKQLRKLGLVGLKREHGTDLCAAIDEMTNLRTLDLCTITEQQYLELGNVRNPPRSLQCLYLKGLLKGIPSWMSLLNNLFKVALKWSRLNDSPLMALKCLPNLLELQLIDCYTGEELTFEVSGFKKLKVLLIEELSALNTIVIQRGAMPGLTRLSLRKCPQLNMLPLRMEMLDQLEEVMLYDMPGELVASTFEYQQTIGRHCDIRCFYLNTQSGSFERVPLSHPTFH